MIISVEMLNISTEAIEIRFTDKVAVVDLTLVYMAYSEPFITSHMIPTTY